MPSAVEGQSDGVKVLPAPVTFKTDKKEYKSIQLPNGLRALLIADARAVDLKELDEEEEETEKTSQEGDDEESEEGEESEDDGEEEEEEEEKEGGGGGGGKLKKSAAALTVGMGSLSDPDKLPGLAHFLEHMVFMGSSKYPDENAYDEFIHQNGGFDNAHTDCKMTTFYFEVQRRKFRQGLDMFAQFFIDPLMAKSAMTRERQAVDSEFQMAMPSDYNKKQQLLGSVAARPNHPLGKFMWGNQESLSASDDEETHKILHDFRLRHYTAGSMTLAVQSQETLETLEAWVLDSFSGVPNNGQEAEAFDDAGNPFEGPESNFHKLYRIVPVKDVYQLDLHWTLPPMLTKYRTDPLGYLSHIVGYEGRGSLTSYLRERVWALSLAAGNAEDGFENNECYSMFSINISLTKAGKDNVDKVLEAVFSYLKMLRGSQPSQRIFNELKQIKSLGFEFGAEPQPSDNVENLAESMQLYPSEMYMTGGELLFEFDSDLIDSCAQKLSEENVCVCYSWKDNKPDTTEKWFKTKYSSEDITPEMRQGWKNAQVENVDKVFFLPEKNEYIAEDFSLLSQDKEAANGQVVYPKEIVSSGKGRLFYKQDHKFQQPRAVASFSILSPKFHQSVENAVCMDLLVMTLDQLMIEDIYPATQALLDYQIRVGERGEFHVSVSGLNDKLPTLLKTIVGHLKEFSRSVSDEKFAAVREQTKRSYFNFIIKPKSIIRDMRLKVLQSPFWTGEEKHAAVGSITVDKIREFADSFCRAETAYVQGLVQGNLSEQTAVEMFNIVAGALEGDHVEQRCATDMANMRCRDLPSGDHYLRVGCHDPKNTNTVVVNYYQMGATASLADYAAMMVAEHIMEEPVFDVLRTKEQLGYSVYAAIRNTFGTLGLVIYVNSQATKFTADFVDERIEAFVEWFLKDKLVKLQDAEYETTIATLVKAQKTADVTLSEEFNRNWSEITERELMFDRKEKLVRLLESTSKAQMVQMITGLMTCGQRRKLSVQVVGNPDGIKIQEEGGEGSADVDPNGVFAQVPVMPATAKPGQVFLTDSTEFLAKLNIRPVHMLGAK